MKKLLSSVAAAGVVALLVSACGSSSSNTARSTSPASATLAGASNSPASATMSGASSSPSSAVLDDLIKAAKAEGSVTLYSSIPAPVLQAWATAFKTKYGISVTTVPVAGNDLLTRFTSELSAGASTADLLTSTNYVALKGLEDQGKLLGWSKTVAPYATSFPSEFYLKEYDLGAIQALNSGFVYNTTKVKASEIPTTWAGLEDPSWKGKLCGWTPSNDVSGALFYDTIRSAVGDDGFKKIAANFVKLYSNVIAENSGVDSGECALGLNSAQFFVGLQPKGAPMAYANAPSAVYPIQVGVINAKAAHPHAAILFLYYIAATSEGNAIINTSGSGSFGVAQPNVPSTFSAATEAATNKANADTQTILGLLNRH